MQITRRSRLAFAFIPGEILYARRAGFRSRLARWKRASRRVHTAVERRPPVQPQDPIRRADISVHGHRAGTAIHRGISSLLFVRPLPYDIRFGLFFISVCPRPRNKEHGRRRGHDAGSVQRSFVFAPLPLNLLV